MSEIMPAREGQAVTAFPVRLFVQISVMPLAGPGKGIPALIDMVALDVPAGRTDPEMQGQAVDLAVELLWRARSRLEAARQMAAPKIVQAAGEIREG